MVFPYSGFVLSILICDFSLLVDDGLWSFFKMITVVILS